MVERDPIWDALKERSQGKFDADRASFLQQAQTDDDGGWTKHTEFHWSRVVNGDRLDYWPSRKKFQYRGRVSRGLRSMYEIIDGMSELKPCPRGLAKPEPTCTDRNQCWEPCGLLGKSAEHAVPASPEDEARINAAIGVGLDGGNSNAEL